MSLKSSPQTLHSLNPGDTVCMIDKSGYYDWDQCVLVIDQTFKDGWVTGYASFVYFDKKEFEGPAYNEWSCTDHDYADAPVYMVVTKDQQMLSVEPGKSIYCGVNEENATE
ncbi:hypothetical protein DSS3PM1_00089 [Bacteriophage DSS3_PM1]|nr:hypothetical protein DSS3PM1_00089 [Bacteriophage DSS3_PM1]